MFGKSDDFEFSVSFAGSLTDAEQWVMKCFFEFFPQRLVFGCSSQFDLGHEAHAFVEYFVGKEAALLGVGYTAVIDADVRSYG